MNWTKIIPRWSGDTIEPPESKKDEGYIAGDKPPAKWENWFRKGVFESLTETQDNVDLCGGAIKGITGKAEVTDAPDITLVETKVIADDFIAHKAESASDDVHGLSNQRGNISALSNTTSATTPHLRQISTSEGSGASGVRSQVSASNSSFASGTECAISNSAFCENIGNTSMLVSSRRTKNESPFTLVGGDSASGNALTSNRKWQIVSQTGNIQHAGTISTGHSFTDFAELMPNLTGIEQGYGLLQTLDGFGVRPANQNERVVGVTSATAGVILGDTPFSWQGRWLKDEWGSYIYESIIDGDTGEEIEVPKENPEWNPDIEQQPRLERPDEWTVVGLVGQVYVRLKEDVEVMDYVKAWSDGVGQKSTEPTNVQVMKITQEYDAEKKYKIGFCLLK